MDRNAFVNMIAPVVVKYAKAYGYKVASPIIAQACLESGYGTSALSKVYNYFGMKAGSSWKGKTTSMKTWEEYTKGQITNITATFRAYSSLDEGVEGYFKFISTARYSNLKKCTTAKTYLETIKADGYATDSKYVDKNMNVVKTLGLEKYDAAVQGITTTPEEAKKENNPYTEPTKVVTSRVQAIIKRQKNYTSTGNGVKWIQWELTKAGYDFSKNGGIDGICGSFTVKCILDFQSKNGLTVDGLAGSKTRQALKNN